MSGSDFVFNVALGAAGYYATLPESGDGLLMVMVKTTSIQADSTMRDHDTLAALLGSNTEADFTNYARKALASVTSTIDDSNERRRASFTNPVSYTSAGGAANNTIGKIVICYDPDTGAGTDSSIIPLTAHAVTITTDGNDLDVSLPAGYFYQAS